MKIKFFNTVIGYDKVLIEDFNYEFSDNKFVMLVGKNGSGKSCLLKTIAGLCDLVDGDIFINNFSFKKISPSELAKSISILLTEKNDLQYVSVFELLKLSRFPFDDGEKESGIKKINEVLELLKIENLKQRYFYELSDGEKQKTMLARALVQEPEVLLLDEPTTYLDIPSKKELVQNLLLIKKSLKIKIIMSTHDCDLFSMIVDEVWYLHNKKVAIYAPDSLKESGASVLFES